MNYEDAIEAIVTREEARQEIGQHDGDGFAEFLQDVGDRDTYTGRQVLDWLGY